MGCVPAAGRLDGGEEGAARVCERERGGGGCRQRDALAAEKKALERRGAAMAEKLRKAWEQAEFLKQMNASLVANQASALYI